jgi:hypothetical protein
MTLRSLQTFAAFALLAAPAFLSAQEISASEEERLEALARADAEVYTPKTRVNVGFRVLTSGGKVHFGNLGIVPVSTTVAAASAGAVTRVYNNGYVDVDTAAANELDASGVQISPPGGRYQPTATDADGNVTILGNFLSYTPGLTRLWSYGTPEQATAKPGYIAMSTYSTTSDGAFMDKKQGMSGGLELEYSHIYGKLSKRTEWGITSGIALNNLNSKVSGSVAATLHTNTDYYSLNGLTAPDTSTASPFVGRSYTNLTDADGNILITNGVETTIPLSAVPNGSLSTSTATVGGTTVNGRWQVKGAYFMVKLGPTIHTQFSERLGMTASIGLAGAYAGTHYTADETFEVPNMTTTITTQEANDASKFLAGYYADLNLEWAANERSGLYTGFTAQKFGDYQQTLGGRTAVIDLGSSVGIRGGFSFRF